MHRILIVIALALSHVVVAQENSFTHADTLRGAQSINRTWWNALKYDISVEFQPAAKSLTGNNVITYQVINTNNNVLQIDLMHPMTIDSVIAEGQKLEFTRDGNAWFVKDKSTSTGIRKLKVYYHGVPPEAIHPPWDGGVIWSKDGGGNDWISVACQGFGASCWYPNKDQQLDEPDSSEVHITVPNSLKGISNGRESKPPTTSNGKTTYHWKVNSPINTYNIIPYIGKYSSFSEVYKGVAGPLDVTYWALDEDLNTAKEYWPSRTKETIKTLEKWFGLYPFYKDGFKLVQAPHLGMEHQSAVAYGNKFSHGYLGRDLSESGWGLKWDFIIVHEAAHEWFGNSITAADAADMWIHEAFATYAEVLYIEDRWGYQAGVDYLVGRRGGIENLEPMMGPYGLNKEGSGDMYPKGANLIHMIRQIINDEGKFKSAMLEMNKKFFHKEINATDVLNFWNSYSPVDLTSVFDQYLKQRSLPVLNYVVEKKGRKDLIRYRWEGCIPGFTMPVKVETRKKTQWIYPGTEFQETLLKRKFKTISREFYFLEMVVK